MTFSPKGLVEVNTMGAQPAAVFGEIQGVHMRGALRAREKIGAQFDSPFRMGTYVYSNIVSCSVCSRIAKGISTVWWHFFVSIMQSQTTA